MPIDRLDLRKSGHLSDDQVQEITRLEPGVRGEYNDYINSLAALNQIEGMLWFTRASCRNVYASLVHNRLCRLALLQSIIGRGEDIGQIIVDSKSMQYVVRRILESASLNISIVLNDDKRVRPFQKLLNLVYSIYQSVNLWLWPRIISGARRPHGSVYYLDSFILKDSINGNGEFSDRYYPGLIEHSPADIRTSFWYAPTIIGVKRPIEYIRMFRDIRRANANIMMKEDWLKLTDYLAAIYYSMLLPRKITKYPKWRGYDVSEILEEEKVLDVGSFSLVNSILIFRFIRRLKRRGVELYAVIDWFENQVIDRALNLGLNKYYPEVKTKGYQGFVVSGDFACQQPIQSEYDGQTLPDKIMVIGNAYVEHRKKYCESLNVSVAPALRFYGTHTHLINSDSEKDTISVLLPINIDSSREIVRICLGIALSDKLRIVLKQHPSCSWEECTSMVPQAKENVFVRHTGTIDSLLSRTRVLLTSSSSVAMQGLLAGISVIIISGNSGPVMNPLAEYVHSDYWNVCNDAECVSSILYADLDIPAIKNIDEYLSPVTDTAVEKMLFD